MTKDNKRERINRVGQSVENEETSNSFVFSSNIEDWMVGYKLKWDRANAKKKC